ncbi:MAG: potassium transporter TrkG [Kiritimatiellia bacterium]|nr:potassium transporter TrkG [Kiritimatiellia bacterium]
MSPQLFIVSSMGMAIIIGAVLLMLPWASRTGQWTDALTALFTATSAMCVTGHTLVETGSYFSHFGQGVILVLFQIGGLGFMTMAMAFLIIAGRRLSLRNETAIIFSMGMRDAHEIKRFLIRTVLLALVIELIAAVVLALCLVTQYDFSAGQAFYHGLFHSVSAFCNAGFSLYHDSLIGLRNNRVFLFTVMGLIVLGGIGFLVLSELYYKWRERRRKHVILSLHSRMVIAGTLFLIIAGWIGFAVLEWGNTLAPLEPTDKLICALFQSVTPRTAGFNVVDMAQTSPATRFMTIALMFIGGSPGSAAGGIKVTTAVVLVFTALAMIRNRRNIVILGRTVSAGVVGAALSVFIIGLIVVLGLFGLLLVTEQNSLSAGRFTFDALLFDTISAFGTVGLTTGIVPLLTAAGKLIIIACMFIGRVGPLTLALFIGMREERELIKYPEEDVIIG